MKVSNKEYQRRRREARRARETTTTPPPAGVPANTKPAKAAAQPSPAPAPPPPVAGARPLTQFPGGWHFVAERVKGIPAGPFNTVTTCLFCEVPFPVMRGAVYAIFRVGAEIVGLACDQCLDDQDQETIARVRAQTQKEQAGA